MKKISAFITFILIISISSISLAFSDTTAHWAEDTINEMQDYRVINGYTDDTFRPDNNMTRAEFVTVIVRLLGLKTESSRYIPDITREDWFYSDIRKAVKAGIIQGNDAGYIRPNDNVTREEAIAIISRAFHITDNSRGIVTSFDDINTISEWARNDVISFVNYGYISGYSDNTIKPKNNMTRAETLVVINRIIPNILVTNLYEGLISGNTLVLQDNVTLRNLTISGNLIISTRVISTLKISNVEVMGNLIVNDYINDTIKKIEVAGETLELQLVEEENYINEKYGVEFAVPKTATVKDFNEDKNIDYNQEDLIIIDIKQNDEYYLKNINSIAGDELKRFANIFRYDSNGKIGKADYILYDDRDGSQMIVIKRDSVVYTLIFFNVVSENFTENVLATMQLLPLENIIESEDVIYKNSKLSLKFTYQNIYVSVDDSYNTGNINEEEAFFKLFIQVTTITDIQNYNIDEIEILLRSLVERDGRILETEKLKVITNEAIKFKIQDDNKIKYSLYVIVGNNLYNFIFTGESLAMNEIGEEIFDDIVRTLEI